MAFIRENRDCETIKFLVLAKLPQGTVILKTDKDYIMRVKRITEMVL